MVLRAIKYSCGRLEILDQLRLPHEEVYINISSCQEAWNAIKSMQVRGAPAIAIVAALSIAVPAAHTTEVGDQTTPSSLAAQQINRDLEYLVTSRPTAVNLSDAATKLKTVVKKVADDPRSECRTILQTYIEAAERMLVDDVQDNERIGKYGAEWILQNKPRGAREDKVLLRYSTAGYGTALGVVRSLHSFGSLHHVFYTETRPYNQGSRLTGYELIHDGIPATLITDSMAAALLNTRRVSENIVAIVVGADRVAANGDTANKIGTYSLAVLARHHGVKFLVAAPRTTIDMETKSGADIVIEERPETEMLNIKGPVYLKDESRVDTRLVQEVCVAAKGTRAWNPAFDVTPAELIDGVVTEKGVVEKDEHGVFRWDKVFGEHAVEDAPEVDAPKPLGMAVDGITATESTATAS
ncbi:MAG: hypothetical protein Q9212_000877 [Teloschistes hypoglaucus]